MLYIKVTPNGNTSLEQAKLISREIQKISRPNADTQSIYRFAWFTKGNETILQINIDDMIPVGNGVNLIKLINSLGNVSGAEKNQLKAYIESKIGSKIKFGNIIPSAIKLYTEDELKTEGWFAVNI